MAQQFGFAQRLKALRANVGLTQKQLAERAGLYLSVVYKAEQGEHDPSWPTVVKLARALGCSVEDFLPEAEPPRRPPKPKKRSE
jgi:transcriptional regulator with XRE-family HTH domain